MSRPRRRRLPVTLLALVGAVACGEAPRPVSRQVPRDVAVIAHRGASWDAPEHTFAAWDLALEQGADWLEFDLQRTADSVLVVFHDDSLDRVARGPAEDCTGPVAAHTLAQLRRCDVGRWFNARHPDRARPAYSNSFDLLFRGIELVTGGQRLHRYEEYLAALAERGLSPEPFVSYLETFRYGMPPHGGFAIGMERLLMQLIGAPNLRQTTLFPRDINRLTP